ncbi:MAG TPA: GtrA family protein [Acidimicrobiales bacterium]|nr:GtrA family protein [Acidimicrobiales bacterium]
MDISRAGLLTWARAPEGRKLVRYSMVSVVSVVVYEFLLFVFLGLMHWSAALANFWAVSISAIPSYYLNRAWTWGKTGRSHLMKEVVPFWGMALLGLAFSTIVVDFAKDGADNVTSVHLVQTLIVMFAGLAAFGVLWIAKFVVLNRVLFVHRPQPASEPADETPERQH